MKERQRRVDAIRRVSTPVENHLIDEYAAGKISRRDFIRRGTVIGMGFPLLGVLASCASPDATTTTGAGTTTTTAAGTTSTTAVAGPITVRNGLVAPAGAIDPVTVADEGGLAVLGQSGEYLAFSDSNLELRPVLAESWSPNDDGSVWTFSLRQGVLFQDGTEMKAADVVASIEGVIGGNAASAFYRALSPGATTATDDYTVTFELDRPVGSFPYLVSSDNYNAVILPAAWWAGYGEGVYEQTFPGTGAWKLEAFEQGVSVSYTKNPDYWDVGRVIPDRIEHVFFAEEAAAVTAYLGGEVDMLGNFSVASGQALLTDANTVVTELRAAPHRQVHLATDVEPFTDKRVRQAMALTLNRADILAGLFNGKADLGNDHPMAPVFPSSDLTVPQREANVEQARQLLADAGLPDGFTVQLSGWNGFEMPTLAQLVQTAAAEIGVTVELNITDAGTYYNDFWLSGSPMGITDYGHRGVPNVYINYALRSDGGWNAAHFNSSAFDSAVDTFVGALDLDSQRAAAKTVEEILLDETPLILPYFYYHLTAAKSNLSGWEVSAMGHVRLEGATLS